MLLKIDRRFKLTDVPKLIQKLNVESVGFEVDGNRDTDFLIDWIVDNKIQVSSSYFKACTIKTEAFCKLGMETCILVNVNFGVKTKKKIEMSKMTRLRF
jgi:hypothetical protein